MPIHPRVLQRLWRGVPFWSGLSGSLVLGRGCLLLLCVWMVACTPLVATQTMPPCDSTEAKGWHTLAPGVHVWQPAPDQEPGPANAGHVMPTSVLVHGTRAWIIDPGPNRRQTQALIERVRCAWGAQVERVFNTHAHAENVLGNTALASAQAQGRVHIMATATTATTMAQRCPGCLDDLTARVGVGAMAQTTIVLPDTVLRPGEALVLGPHRLVVHEMRDAHTHSDLVLWHQTLRIAWVGGLVYGQRLPELAQGSLLGWRSALAELRSLQPQWVVGATIAGPSGAGASAQDALAATDAYLAHVQQVVLRGMEDGLQVSELPLQAAAPFDGWAGHARHGFNLQRAWRELEPAWMDGLLRP